MLALMNVFRSVLSIGVIVWLFMAAFVGAPPQESPVETRPPTASKQGQAKVVATTERKGQEDNLATTSSDQADIIEGSIGDTKTAQPQAADKESQEETAAQPPMKSMAELQPTQPTLPEANEFKDANEAARASVVNIVCETRDKNTIKTVTGSGVIIDARGVILTNAHLAQFFLLSDYPEKGATACTVRTGNPAQDKYKAELLYIPITWVQRNARSVTEEDPTGTGEGDYALLHITAPLDENTSLPSSFSYLPVNIDEEVVSTEESVIVASYPALVAEIDAIKNSLYLVSSVTHTGTLYTFGDNFLDLFALNGTISAQRGSSGGAIVNEQGELIGVVVTSTENALVLNRELRALTPAYINRSLLKENGTSLAQLLFGDLVLREKAFKLATAPLLNKLLIQALESAATTN